MRKPNAETPGRRRGRLVPRLEPELRGLRLFVTDQERELLGQIVKNEGYGETVRELLESFVADLTNSGRRGWPWGKQGAQDWLEAHRGGWRMEMQSSQQEGRP